jgi:hypothetical protein
MDFNLRKEQSLKCNGREEGEESLPLGRYEIRQGGGRENSVAGD